MGDSGGGPKTEAEKARDRVKLLMGELVDTEKSMLDSLALFDPPPELLNEKYPAIVQYNDHVKAIVKSGAPVFELFNELNSNLDNPNFDLVAYHKRLKDAMDVHAENLAKAVIGADAFMKEIAELQKADAKKPLPVNIRNFLFVSIKPAVEAKPADKALGTPEVLAVPQRRVDTAMALGIMAIQRLPRYEMLSKEMIKNTPPEMQERVPFLIRDSENKIIPLSTYAQNANERTRLHEALKELNKVKGTKSAFKGKDYGVEKNKTTLDAQDKIKDAIQNQYLDKIGLSPEELTKTLMYLDTRTHDSEIVPMSTLPNGRIEEAKPGKFYLDNDGNYVVIDPQGKRKSGNLNELDIPEEDIKKLPSMDKDPNFKQRLLKVISDKGLIRKNKGKRKEGEASLLETMNLNIDDKPSIITISLSKENLNKPDKVSKALDVALKLKEKGVKVHFSDTFNDTLKLPKNQKFETIRNEILSDASKEGQEIENKTEAEPPTRVSISGDVPVPKEKAAGVNISQPGPQVATPAQAAPVQPIVTSTTSASAATLREKRAASMETLAAKKVAGVSPSPLLKTPASPNLITPDQRAAKPAATTSTESAPAKAPQTPSVPPLRIKLPVSEIDAKKPVTSSSTDTGARVTTIPTKPAPARPPLKKSEADNRKLISNPVKEFQSTLSKLPSIKKDSNEFQDSLNAAIDAINQANSSENLSNIDFPVLASALIILDQAKQLKFIEEDVSSQEKQSIIISVPEPYNPKTLIEAFQAAIILRAKGFKIGFTDDFVQKAAMLGDIEINGLNYQKEMRQFINGFKNAKENTATPPLPPRPTNLAGDGPTPASTSTTNTAAPRAASNIPKPPSHPAPNRLVTGTPTSSITSTSPASIVGPTPRPPSPGSKALPPSGRPTPASIANPLTNTTGVTPSASFSSTPGIKPLLPVSSNTQLSSLQLSTGVTSPLKESVDNSLQKFGNRTLSSQKKGSTISYRLSPSSGLQATVVTKPIYAKVAEDTFKNIRESSSPNQQVIITPGASLNDTARDDLISALKTEGMKPENKDIAIQIKVGAETKALIDKPLTPSQNTSIPRRSGH